MCVGGAKAREDDRVVQERLRHGSGREVVCGRGGGRVHNATDR